MFYIYNIISVQTSYILDVREPPTPSESVSRSVVSDCLRPGGL